MSLIIYLFVSMKWAILLIFIRLGIFLCVVTMNLVYWPFKWNLARKLLGNKSEFCKIFLQRRWVFVLSQADGTKYNAFYLRNRMSSTKFLLFHSRIEKMYDIVQNFYENLSDFPSLLLKLWPSMLQKTTFSIRFKAQESNCPLPPPSSMTD